MKVSDLFESPMYLGAKFRHNVWDSFETDFEDLTRVKEIKPGLFTATSYKSKVFWYGTREKPTVGVFVKKRPGGGYRVQTTAKDTSTIGKPPFANDLYVELVKFLQAPLFSDFEITKNGANIWRKLLQDKRKVSIYDEDARTVTRVKSLKDLDKVLKSSSSQHSFRLDP